MCQNVKLEVFDGKNIGKRILSTLTKMFDGCIVFNLIENTNYHCIEEVVLVVRPCLIMPILCHLMLIRESST